MHQCVCVSGFVHVCLGLSSEGFSVYSFDSFKCVLFVDGVKICPVMLKLKLNYESEINFSQESCPRIISDLRFFFGASECFHRMQYYRIFQFVHLVFVRLLCDCNSLGV